MTPYFRVKIQKQRTFSTHQTILNKFQSRKWRIKVFLKGAYFINLIGFLAALIVVSLRQINGYYQCSSITVRLGRDEVWEEDVIGFELERVPGDLGLYRGCVLLVLKLEV